MTSKGRRFPCLLYLDGVSIPEDTIAPLRVILRVFVSDDLAAIGEPMRRSIGRSRFGRCSGVGRSGLIYLGKPGRLILGAAIPRIVPQHADKAATFEGMPKGDDRVFGRTLGKRR